METFCKIYLKTDKDLASIVKSFTINFSVKKDKHRALFDLFDCYFSVNAYYSPLDSNDLITSSKYYCDVEFPDNYDIQDCISKVKTFLEWFRSQNIEVLASCDYEDQL